MNNQEMPFADPESRPPQQGPTNTDTREQEAYVPQPITLDPREHLWSQAPPQQEEFYPGTASYPEARAEKISAGEIRRWPRGRRSLRFWLIVVLIACALLGRGVVAFHQATILQTYRDTIQDLLLKHNLLTSKPSDDVARLARARTLTALQGLDPERKGRLVQFLYEAKLLGFLDTNGKQHTPIISLLGANLSDADLLGADLSGANLVHANLVHANLFDANLVHAYLSNVNLSGTNLFYANLSGADLFYANLSGAYLDHTNLSNAYLGHANLSGADLFYANLSGASPFEADLSGADLSGVHNLTQQQLDHVYTCKDTILPKGFICHHNQ